MMNRVCIPVLSMLLAIMASCAGGSKKTGIEGGIVEENLYAKGYEIIHYNGFTTVEIANPWDTTKILQRYVLVEKGADLPSNLPEGTLIRTPLDNIIMYTTRGILNSPS